MKIYRLEKQQTLNISLDEAWEFFSSPLNLKTITPDYMGFDIVSDLKDGEMYPGMIIEYIVRPLMGLPMRWTSEITHVKAPYYFVDEQRFGPYAFWHHKHFFEETDGGVLTTDIVHYGLPLGILGRMVQPFMVKPKLNQIFGYRNEVLEKRFNGKAKPVIAN